MYVVKYLKACYILTHYLTTIEEIILEKREGTWEKFCRYTSLEKIVSDFFAILPYFIGSKKFLQLHLLQF